MILSLANIIIIRDSVILNDMLDYGQTQKSVFSYGV